MLDFRQELRALPSADWPAYLDERSGLPGPRANLTLAAAAAQVADEAVIAALLSDDGEYTTMCAAAAIGLRADDPAQEERALAFASNDRWRVQEGLIIGLQLLGDTAPESLARIVRRWVGNGDRFVVRVAVAANCEPRLLRTPDRAALGIEACGAATVSLVGLPALQRKDAGARKLRQALGYCWSVAIAADPAHGLPVFHALDTSDPDVAWIVDQNLRKKRLSKLL